MSKLVNDELAETISILNTWFIGYNAKLFLGKPSGCPGRIDTLFIDADTGEELGIYSIKEEVFDSVIEHYGIIRFDNNKGIELINKYFKHNVDEIACTLDMIQSQLTSKTEGMKICPKCGSEMHKLTPVPATPEQVEYSKTVFASFLCPECYTMKTIYFGRPKND